MIEPISKRRPLALLGTMKPLDEPLPRIDDLAPVPDQGTLFLDDARRMRVFSRCSTLRLRHPRPRTLEAKGAVGGVSAAPRFARPSPFDLVAGNLVVRSLRLRGIPRARKQFVYTVCLTKRGIGMYRFAHEIVWDEPKRLANKHGLDFADLTVAFFEDALFLPSKENRWRGIGPNARGIICVVFATLGKEAVSVISMRRARMNERKLYVERLKEDE